MGEISETSTNEQESAGVPRTAIDDNHGTNLLLPSRVLLPLHDAVAAAGGGSRRNDQQEEQTNFYEIVLLVLHTRSN